MIEHTIDLMLDREDRAETAAMIDEVAAQFSVHRHYNQPSSGGTFINGTVWVTAYCKEEEIESRIEEGMYWGVIPSAGDAPCVVSKAKCECGTQWRVDYIAWSPGRCEIELPNIPY